MTAHNVSERLGSVRVLRGRVTVTERRQISRDGRCEPSTSPSRRPGDNGIVWPRADEELSTAADGRFL